MAYTDEQCQAAYGGEMRSVTVPSGSLNTANAYVNTGACKLYQTPGVTFCTNNPDGTQECSTVWRAESTGEPNDPDAEGANVEESPFQLTDNPSSCANGSYSSGGKSYCYTGQSSDINTIHIGDDGNPVTDDGGTDTGGNTGGGDTGSGNDGGSTGGGGSSGGGSTGGGGSSGGGGGGASGGGGSTGGGSSDGGGGSSGGGSTGGGSTGGGSTGGGSTGGDTSTGGGDTSTDDDATPPDDTDTPSEGDTGSSDSGNNDSGDGEESEEPGDGLDAVLDAIGGVRKAINNGFSNLVDTFTNQDGAPTAADVESEFDGQGLTDDLMSQLDTQNEDVQGEITQRYRDLFEDDSSLLGKGLSYVKGVATAWLPEIPGGGGCVPLTFSFQGHTVTIECRVFDLIKAALSWLLFFFTCYQITMIALSYRSASEG
ncbi:hypothetical protein [Salinicola sp. RZ23]|uniref:hypothetical protein n=1 Tax=Salinicola sp. RZ23 TaxID=1949087 RepID=UPI0018E560F9|nr:hypothetical protein [Salinicola sp. RZ23]